MIFAQIKNEIILNIIVLTDESEKDLFSSGFDFLVRIDDLNPVPRIGDGYVDGTFVFVQNEEHNFLNDLNE